MTGQSSRVSTSCREYAGVRYLGAKTDRESEAGGTASAGVGLAQVA